MAIVNPFWVKYGPKMIITSLSLFLLLALISVSGGNEHDLNESRGIILPWLEILILVCFLLTIYFNLRIVKIYRTSVTGRPFIYILFGMIILAFSRLYILFYNFEFYNISGISLQLVWHLIFYTGLMVFLVVIINLDKRIVENDLKRFDKTDTLVILFFVAINLLIIGSSNSINKWANKLFIDSPFNSLGILHFIAFFLAALLSLKLIRIRSKASDSELGTLMSSFVPSLLIFLIIMSFNHFWELITESWQLINLPSATVETGEQFFWLPAYFVTTIGLRKVLLVSQEIFDVKEIEEFDGPSNTVTPISIDVLKVLTYHLGSSALPVAQQCSHEMGINFNQLTCHDLSAFSDVIQKNSSGLIGDYPSRFLKQALNLITLIYE